ncbi:MAG: glycosyltransferase [Chloroflexota bacterium]|nr:glycosyltransferase [Chloroflexota bacterium]
MGHKVTYLTTDHWAGGAPPHIPAVEIIPVSQATGIYAGARRQIRPVVTFGAAVAKYLAQHGSSFDVVHSTATSPAAAHAVVAIAKRRGYLPVLDWWEVWETAGWRSYLGPAGGEVAARLEQRLARATHVPVVYSRLHRARLTATRRRDDALQLSGVLPARQIPPHACPAQPYVLLANRLIPEKQTASILPALLIAKQTLPSLGAVIVGSGPLETELRAEIARLGLGKSVRVRPGLSDDELAGLMQQALCLALLSRREGYGLVAVEAMGHGTPSLILDHPDSAASEHVAPCENGVLIQSLDPEPLASAILSIHAAGTPFRERTLAWRRRHDDVLAIEHSLPCLISRYQQGAAERRTNGWRNARP